MTSVSLTSEDFDSPVSPDTFNWTNHKQNAFWATLDLLRFKFG